MARQDCQGLAELLSEYAAVSMLAHPEDVAECSLCTPAGVSAVAVRHDGRPVGRFAPRWLVDGDGVLVGAVASDPMARVIAETAGVMLLEPPAGFDFGLLDCDGEGTALVDDALARNLAGGRAEAEQVLAEWLGISQVLWLETVVEETRVPARFFGPALVAVALARDERAPDHAALAANRERLAATPDAAGRPITVIELPCPKRHGGCYADSVVAGGLVVVPAFEDRADDEAFARLVAALPGASLVSYPATFLVPMAGGGLGSVVAVAPAGD